MTRPELGQPAVSEHAAQKMTSFHAEVVAEVRAAVDNHPVVVVGMGWNPHVRRARRALEEAGIPHHYVGRGNYAVGWKERLAIKLWSGWPTFPMVFVRGVLIGGADQLQHELADGTFRQRLG